MTLPYPYRGQKSLEISVPPKQPSGTTILKSIFGILFKENTKFHIDLQKALDAKKHVIITGPMGVGKSAATLASALHTLLNGKGSYSLIIYPTPNEADYQEKQFREILKSSYFSWSCELRRDFEGINELKKPTIFITDIYTVHKKLLLPSTLRNTLWGNVSLIALENIHKYSGPFGLNVSLLMRRIHALLSFLQNENYTLLFSTLEVSNLDDLIMTLTGLKASENFEVLSAHSYASEKKDFIFWIPSLLHYDLISEKGSDSQRILLMKRPLVDETIELAVNKLSEEKTVGIVWEKIGLDLSEQGTLHEGIVKNIKSSSSSSLFIADEISNLFHKVRSSTGKLDVLILVEPLVPLNFLYRQLEEVPFLKEIYFVLPHDLIYQIFLTDQNLLEGQSQLIVEIPEIDNSTFRKHYNFLKEEIPTLSEEDIQTCFGEDYVQKLQEADITAGREDFFLFLPLSEKSGLPLTERDDVDLQKIDSLNYFKVYDGNNLIGEIPENIAYTFYFPKSIVTIDGQKFIVDKIDTPERSVNVSNYTLNEPRRVFKIISEVNTEAEQLLDSREVVTGITVEFLKGTIKEEVWGVRAFKGTDESEINDEKYSHPLTFKYDNVYLLKIKSRELKDKNGVLHILAHLMKAFLHTKFFLHQSEVGLKFFSDEEYGTIIIYDRSGLHYKALKTLMTPGEFKSFLNFAYNILKECPCASGCLSCSKLLQCESQEYNEPVDKISTLNFLSTLLNRIEEFQKIQIFKTQGVQDESKLLEIKQKCIEVLRLKTGIKFDDQSQVYNVRFMNNAELHRYGGPLGITISNENGEGVILINPGGMTGKGKDAQYRGITEQFLYFVVSHELAHNWQNYKISSTLRGIQNWSNLFDPQNVPFGNLIDEGHANWCAFKVMDYFGQRELKETTLIDYSREYRVGLKVFLYLENKYGIEGINEFLTKGMEALSKEDRDYDTLLYNSGAAADINTEYRRLLNEGGLQCFNNQRQKEKPRIISFGIYIFDPIIENNLAYMEIRDFLRIGGDWALDILRSTLFPNVPNQERIPCEECACADYNRPVPVCFCPLYRAAFINNVDYNILVDAIINNEQLLNRINEERERQD